MRKMILLLIPMLFFWGGCSLLDTDGYEETDNYVFLSKSKYHFTFDNAGNIRESSGKCISDEMFDKCVAGQLWLFQKPCYRIGDDGSVTDKRFHLTGEGSDDGLGSFYCDGNYLYFSNLVGKPTGTVTYTYTEPLLTYGPPEDEIDDRAMPLRMLVVDVRDDKLVFARAVTKKTYIVSIYTKADHDSEAFKNMSAAHKEYIESLSE